MFHFVRVGVLGHVGRFSRGGIGSPSRAGHGRLSDSAGLEVGEVLSHAEGFTADVDGTLLRRITVEDDLLLDRLERHRLAAFEACSAKLAERGISAALVDVEHLFDGESLFFYFLGEITPEVDELTAELAEIYDARVQFRKFTETLTAGCGPGCGTAEAAGQGCAEGGCSTCAMAKVCRN